MSQWLGHLVLHSTGLAIAGAVALVIRAVWKKDPIASYRFLVFLLLSAFCLPAAQLAVQGAGDTWDNHKVDMLSQVWWTDEAETDTSRVPLAELDFGAKPSATDEIPDVSAFFAEAADWRQVDISEELGTADELPAVEEELVAEAAAELVFGEIGPEVVDSPRHGHILGSLTPSSVEAAVRGLDWSAMPENRTIGLIYALGLLLVGLFQASRFYRTGHLLRRAKPVTDRRVLDIWSRVAREFPRAGRVRLMTSSRLESPACWGLFRPTLVIPSGDLATRDERVLEWALRHELVHIVRGDIRTAAMQAVLTSIFWFHPVSWWLSKQLDQLREISCDCLVVRRSGKRKSYAMALIDYAHCDRGRSRFLSPLGRGDEPVLVHWSGSKTQLHRRIEMLEHTKKRSSFKRQLACWTAAAAVFGLLWAGQLAIAATLIPDEHDQQDGDKKTSGAPADRAEIAIDIDLEPATEETDAVEASVDITTESALVVAETTRANAVLFCHVSLGVVLTTVSPERAKALDVDRARCLVIAEVAKKSPAAKAGLEKGDIIVSFDGNSHVTPENLVARIKSKNPGQHLHLEIIRGDRRREIVVTLQRFEFSDRAKRQARESRSAGRARPPVAAPRQPLSARRPLEAEKPGTNRRAPRGLPGRRGTDKRREAARHALEEARQKFAAAKALLADAENIRLHRADAAAKTAQSALSAMESRIAAIEAELEKKLEEIELNLQRMHNRLIELDSQDADDNSDARRAISAELERIESTANRGHELKEKEADAARRQLRALRESLDRHLSRRTQVADKARERIAKIQAKLDAEIKRNQSRIAQRVAEFEKSIRKSETERARAAELLAKQHSRELSKRRQRLVEAERQLAAIESSSQGLARDKTDARKEIEELRRTAEALERKRRQMHAELQSLEQKVRRTRETLKNEDKGDALRRAQRMASRVESVSREIDSQRTRHRREMEKTIREYERDLRRIERELSRDVRNTQSRFTARSKALAGALNASRDPRPTSGMGCGNNDDRSRALSKLETSSPRIARRNSTGKGKTDRRSKTRRKTASRSSKSRSIARSGVVGKSRGAARPSPRKSLNAATVITSTGPLAIKSAKASEDNAVSGAILKSQMEGLQSRLDAEGKKLVEKISRAIDERLEERLGRSGVELDKDAERRLERMLKKMAEHLGEKVKVTINIQGNTFNLHLPPLSGKPKARRERSSPVGRAMEWVAPDLDDADHGELVKAFKEATGSLETLKFPVDELESVDPDLVSGLAREIEAIKRRLDRIERRLEGKATSSEREGRSLPSRKPASL